MLPATTIVILAAIVLLVLLVAASYYRHAHGYRAMSLTCHRFRYRSRKAAMLASMDDAESDSDDEEAGELSPVPSGHFSRNASASDFVHNGGAAAEVVAAGKGSALLLQLPTELWLEVLGSTGPYHHHVVCALRESCHAMRRHLQGTPFWYCLCKQAFAPWEAWMSAIGWDDYGACAADPARVPARVPAETAAATAAATAAPSAEARAPWPAPSVPALASAPASRQRAGCRGRVR